MYKLKDLKIKLETLFSNYGLVESIEFTITKTNLMISK